MAIESRTHYTREDELVKRVADVTEEVIQSMEHKVNQRVKLKAKERAVSRQVAQMTGIVNPIGHAQEGGEAEGQKWFFYKRLNGVWSPRTSIYPPNKVDRETCTPLIPLLKEQQNYTIEQLVKMFPPPLSDEALRLEKEILNTQMK